GSWLQVVSQMIGSRGKIIGVDITPIKFRAPNVTTLEMDILHSDSAKKLEAFGLFDIVLSDLAPKTSGIKTRDQALSLELDQQVINLAQNLLKPGGAIIIKIFQSPDMHHFIKQIETMFSFVHVYKPQASRDRSFETYLIGLDKID
ncbi:MAG: RlmE family RNA methyltransferase, partial [Candidatus Komeilibacteria bacterium]|nr:RlmE family RNA methyltransferase [Candidatus Komeilibacteria bacterium]